MRIRSVTLLIGIVTRRTPQCHWFQSKRIRLHQIQYISCTQCFSLAFFVLIVVLHLSILCCYSNYSIYTTTGQPLYRLLVQKSTYSNSNHNHNAHKPQHGFKNEHPNVYEHIELMWNAELNRDILVVFRHEDNGLVAFVLLWWHKTL